MVHSSPHWPRRALRKPTCDFCALETVFSPSVHSVVKLRAVGRKFSKTNVECHGPPNDAPSCHNLEKHSAYTFAVRPESPGGRATSPRGAESYFHAFGAVFSLTARSAVRLQGSYRRALRGQCAELCTTQRPGNMSKPGEALGIHICSPLGESWPLRSVLRAAKTNFRALAAVFARSVHTLAGHVSTQPAALRDQC